MDSELSFFFLFWNCSFSCSEHSGRLLVTLHYVFDWLYQQNNAYIVNKAGYLQWSFITSSIPSECTFDVHSRVWRPGS
jgi:hypothetical protein